MRGRVLQELQPAAYRRQVLVAINRQERPYPEGMENAINWEDLARLTRFERATPAFGGQYSIQLSYRRLIPD